MEWKSLPSQRQVEYLLYGNAGSQSSAFTETVFDEVLISMEDENEEQAEKS